MYITFAFPNKQWQWYQGLSWNYGSVHSMPFHIYSLKQIRAIWQYLYEYMKNANHVMTSLTSRCDCSGSSAGQQHASLAALTPLDWQEVVETPRTLDKNQLVFATGLCSCSHWYTANLNLSCKVFFFFTCPDKCSSLFFHSPLFVT